MLNTYGQFRVSKKARVNVYGLCEEAGQLGKNIPEGTYKLYTKRILVKKKKPSYCNTTGGIFYKTY